MTLEVINLGCQDYMDHQVYSMNSTVVNQIRQNRSHPNNVQGGLILWYGCCW